MREQKNRKKKIFLVLKIIGVLFCTIIGGYGILRAPESDQSELEESLRKNEQQLALELEQPDEESADQAGISENMHPENPQSPSSQPQEKAVPESDLSGTLTVIGDSVFLGAAPSFKKLVADTVIDAKVSRQVYQALDVAKKLNKKNKLRNTVVLSLGINGNFNPATGQELIDYLGPGRTICWINAFGKEKDIQRDVNETIRNLAQSNINVHVISWAEEAKKHPDWFYRDGTHLNEKGQPGFASFVKKELSRELKSQ